MKNMEHPRLDREREILWNIKQNMRNEEKLIAYINTLRISDICWLNANYYCEIISFKDGAIGEFDLGSLDYRTRNISDEEFMEKYCPSWREPLYDPEFYGDTQ